MPNEKNFHVTKREDGNWQAKREGADRASFVAPTQSEVESAAKDVARREGGEVFTHRADGKIRDRDSYGNDPCPPKDSKH